jgi:hypothetical protein
MGLNEILLNLLPLSIVSILLVVYFYQYIKYKRNTPFLLAAFITVVGATVLYDFVPYILQLSDTAANAFQIIATFALHFLPFFFYMHFQSLVSLKPPLNRFTVLVGLTIMAMTLQIPQIFGLLPVSDPENMSYYIFLGIIQVLQVFLAMLFCVIIAKRNASISNNRPTKIELIAVILIMIAWTMGSFDFMFGYANIILPEGINLLYTAIYTIIGSSGFLLFLINYFINIDYLYSVPIDIHSIIFYNNIGIPLYEKKISTVDISEDLLSGAFTAISAILKESINESVKLSFIDLGLHSVFFGSLDELGTIALICDTGSSFFVKSIDRFIATLPVNLHELLSEASKNGQITDELINEMDNHLYMTFPFLKNN